MEIKQVIIPVKWTGQPKCTLGVTYKELVEKLGKPNGKSGDGKTRATWNLQISEGVYIMIYDWKEYDTPLEEVIYWTLVCKQTDIKTVSEFLKIFF